MWKIVKTANGRKSCDNDDLCSNDIPAVLSVLEESLQINYENKGGLGLDIIALDFQADGKCVTIGWDNWSGIFIMSKEPVGDIVIEKIYEILIKEIDAVKRG